jgi:hypothetical protein
MIVHADEVAAIMAYRASRQRWFDAIDADAPGTECDAMSDAADAARRVARAAEHAIALRAYPVRKRIAECIVWACDKACALTRHAGACWVLNRSPIRHAWRWAVCFADKEIFDAVEGARGAV